MGNPVSGHPALSGTAPSPKRFVTCPFQFRTIVKQHAMTGSGLGPIREPRPAPESGGDGWGPGIPVPVELSPSPPRNFHTSRALFRMISPLPLTDDPLDLFWLISSQGVLKRFCEIISGSATEHFFIFFKISKKKIDTDFFRKLITFIVI